MNCNGLTSLFICSIQMSAWESNQFNIKKKLLKVARETQTHVEQNVIWSVQKVQHVSS